MTATTSELHTLWRLLVEHPLPDSDVRQFAAHRREHAALCAEIGSAAANEVLCDVIELEQARRRQPASANTSDQRRL